MFHERNGRRIEIDPITNGIVLMVETLHVWFVIHPPASFVATYGNRDAMKKWLENWIEGYE